MGCLENRNWKQIKVKPNAEASIIRMPQEFLKLPVLEGIAFWVQAAQMMLSPTGFPQKKLHTAVSRRRPSPCRGREEEGGRR